jgi:hypothetical protein
LLVAAEEQVELALVELVAVEQVDIEQLLGLYLQ